MTVRTNKGLALGLAAALLVLSVSGAYGQTGAAKAKININTATHPEGFTNGMS